MAGEILHLSAAGERHVRRCPTAENRAQPRPNRLRAAAAFHMMGLVSLLEPARIANYLSASPLYRHDFHSVHPGEVTASNGMTLACGPLPGETHPR